MNYIYRLMQLNRLVKSHRPKFAYVLLAHKLNLRHLFIKFDPIMACNLNCGMCYFSNKEFRKSNKGAFKDEEVNRIAEILFPRALHITVGCSAEPTLYKNFPELIKLAKNYKVPNVGLVTNGQLLTEDHLEKLISYGLDEIIISVHGVKKDTYESLMVNSSFERFHDVLRALDEVKGRLQSRTPALRLNFTVNPDNLDELSDFFEAFGRYSISTLQVRPIIDFGNTAYANKNFSPYVDKYHQTIKKLSAISKKRKMIFLANIVDPTYQTEVYSSVIVDSVLRYVSPKLVWRRDFDWKNENYDEYCERIQWTDHLSNCVFKDFKQLPKASTETTYEITF